MSLLRSHGGKVKLKTLEALYSDRDFKKYDFSPVEKELGNLLSVTPGHDSLALDADRSPVLPLAGSASTISWVFSPRVILHTLSAARAVLTLSSPLPPQPTPTPSGPQSIVHVFVLRMCACLRSSVRAFAFGL